MFAGLIEEVGRVVQLRATNTGGQLQITAQHVSKRVRTGDSIAVNGCCLTISARCTDRLTFDLLQETIDRTNLGSLGPENAINLERPLACDGRIGGHFVQGHVDCVSSIVDLAKKGPDFRLEIELPVQFAHYVVAKGSIAVNGISLTIAELTPKNFVVWVIPYTRQHTNLAQATSGDLLNLEFDILAKYVERLMPRSQNSAR